jgi:hypothetical protein
VEREYHMEETAQPVVKQKFLWSLHWLKRGNRLYPVPIGSMWGAEASQTGPLRAVKSSFSGSW